MILDVKNKFKKQFKDGNKRRKIKGILGICRTRALL